MTKNKKEQEKKLKKYLKKNKEEISVYFKQHIAAVGVIPDKPRTAK